MIDSGSGPYVRQAFPAILYGLYLRLIEQNPIASLKPTDTAALCRDLDIFRLTMHIMVGVVLVRAPSFWRYARRDRSLSVIRDPFSSAVDMVVQASSFSEHAPRSISKRDQSPSLVGEFKYGLRRAVQRI